MKLRGRARVDATFTLALAAYNLVSPAQAPGGTGITVRGKRRIVEMLDYEPDYPGMMEPAYIFFDGKGGGEFAFGCVTGSLYGAADADAVDFTWEGNDEMDETCGDGLAELHPTAPSKGISASTAATKSPSTPAGDRLLQ